MRTPGAALLEIGNELLSGKVVDTNGPLVIADLRALGVTLHEIRVVRDDVPAIARAVRELSDAYETVFTSGGVGPTHDDMTLAGIAAAFGERLVRNETLASMIRAFYQGEANEHLLRMADVPESTVLLHSDALRIPFVTVRNVYVLPGEPTIFKKKWEAVRERFRQSPFALRRLFTRLDEGEIAGWLAELEAAYAVQVGSYPRYDTSDYAVMVTVEGKDPATVDAAFAALSLRFPPGAILRSE